MTNRGVVGQLDVVFGEMGGDKYSVFGLWTNRSSISLIRSASLVVISDSPAHSGIIAVVESSLLLANECHSLCSPLFHSLARRLITRFHFTPKSIPRIMSWLISSTARNCSDPGCPLILINIRNVPCTVMGVPVTPFTCPVDSCSRFRYLFKIRGLTSEIVVPGSNSAR